MEGKHTPGPWEHYDDTTPAGKTGRHEIVALGRTVARVYYSDEQGAADAQLISAAPDLVKALKEARSMVSYSASGYTHSGEMTTRAQRVLAVIDQALTKAGSAA